MRRREHVAQAVDQVFIERAQPARVELAVQRGHEQLGRIDGVRVVGQQLVAQALGQFAEHRGALRKAEIGEQHGDVHRLRDRLPPQLKALAQHGRLLGHRDQFVHALGRSFHRLTIATDPVEQRDQLQIALCERGLGIDGGEELRECLAVVLCAFLQWSTRWVGELSWPPLPSASSTNRLIGQVNCSPSSATQK